MSTNSTTIYQDWTGVTVTPSGGSLLAIPDVIDVSIDAMAIPVAFGGDLTTLPTLIRTPAKTRKIRITGTAVHDLLSLPEDTPCTVVAILQNLANGTGTGALTFTLIDAVRTQGHTSGPADTPARAWVEFEAYSTDGTTDPLSITVA